LRVGDGGDPAGGGRSCPADRRREARRRLSAALPAAPPFPVFLFISFLLPSRKRKRKASAMTSQMIDQSLLPGPLAGTAAPDAPGARHCKRPGCGSGRLAAGGAHV